MKPQNAEIRVEYTLTSLHFGFRFYFVLNLHALAKLFALCMYASTIHTMAASEIAYCPTAR